VRSPTLDTPPERVHAHARTARAERAADLARLRRHTHTDARGRTASVLRDLAARLDPISDARSAADRRSSVDRRSAAAVR
jgi:hypothetical protein